MAAMDGECLYVGVAMAYGLLGLAVSAPYTFCPRLREAPQFHAFTIVLMLLAALIASMGGRFDFRSFATFHLGAQFFLFLGASLCYVPAAVFLVLHYAERGLERALMAASTQEPPRPPSTPEEQWKRVQAHLESLAADPTNPTTRERLADTYVQLGFLDSAVYEYLKAAEWLERGYAHGHLLYKAALVVVERKRDVAGAVILLRRIVRIYPKSYFASYARRILSHYEAHQRVLS
jgi:tetratricopeptide (TPR) repeat protein